MLWNKVFYCLIMNDKTFICYNGIKEKLDKEIIDIGIVQPGNLKNVWKYSWKQRKIKSQNGYLFYNPIYENGIKTERTPKVRNLGVRTTSSRF